MNDLLKKAVVEVLVNDAESYKRCGHPNCKEKPILVLGSNFKEDNKLEMPQKKFGKKSYLLWCNECDWRWCRIADGEKEKLKATNQLEQFLTMWKELLIGQLGREGYKMALQKNLHEPELGLKAYENVLICPPGWYSDKWKEFVKKLPTVKKPPTVETVGRRLAQAEAAAGHDN